jgi:hypothetical protein
MSLKIIDPHTIHITGTRASSLQQHLDEAVNKLIGAAAYARAGILLTRHSATEYTAALDTNVPYGQTIERVH